MGMSDEKKQRILELWKQGLTASQIAAEVGGLTRNSVIGLIHRQGLTNSVAPRAAERAKQVFRSVPLSVAISGNNALLLRAEKPDSELSVWPDLVPDSLNIKLFELTEQTCKWPLGDPGSDEFGFCGQSTWGAFPYCQYHASVAYDPVSRSENDDDARHESSDQTRLKLVDRHLPRAGEPDQKDEQQNTDIAKEDESVVDAMGRILEVAQRIVLESQAEIAFTKEWNLKRTAVSRSIDRRQAAISANLQAAVRGG